MPSRPRPGTRCLIAVQLAALVGCGGGHEASVSGTVFLDEQPLSGGNVTFYPMAGGPAVYGQIGSEGRYVLQTGSEQGLAPGKYRVTVVATENPPVPDGGTPAVGKLITPPRYGRRSDTDLEVTVEAGANEAPLRLTSE